MKKNYDNNPLITIGITSYNSHEYIERAIASAVNQKWRNLEILVVDDCSTDNSIAIINRLISLHQNITLIEHSVNLGIAGARQTIIDQANGEFIAFFDDDDESSTNRIGVQHKRILSYENESGCTMIACYTSGKRIYPNGYELIMEAIGSKPAIPHGNAVADRLLFYGQPSEDFFFGAGTPTCSLMARKSTFTTLDGFDHNFRRVEDIDFAIRLALSGGHFIGCQEQLLTQYATEGSDKAPDKNLAAELQLADKYKEYLVSVGRFKYAKTWPLLRYYHFKKCYFKFSGTLLVLLFRYPIKTTTHFLRTVPRRLLHERKMNAQTDK